MNKTVNKLDVNNCSSCVVSNEQICQLVADDNEYFYCDESSSNLNYETEKYEPTKTTTRKNNFRFEPIQQKRRRMEYHLTIQLRNARERNRVRAVNEAFATLRKMIPYTAHRSKRVSKVKTLQKAVQYIAELTALLNNTK